MPVGREGIVLRSRPWALSGAVACLGAGPYQDVDAQLLEVIYLHLATRAFL
ncbi:hypothetical protein [Actinacidiphila oryziradicis]|uniref:hypothetical protein n=1 Tax=Actinacidiphila oryziradicis TaxID=2571141 RepID=UPI00145D36DD|nr:hypothetical protein [Actinacidiphila oryziradicis]